jgi:hypothetical protein
MTEREEKRERAYHYIVNKVKTHMELPPNFSNKQLANILALSDNDRFSIEVDLNRLEKGQADPSPKLIAGFKKWFVPLNGEDEINSYLVTPFLTDS